MKVLVFFAALVAFAVASHIHAPISTYGAGVYGHGYPAIGYSNYDAGYGYPAYGHGHDYGYGYGHGYPSTYSNYGYGSYGYPSAYSNFHGIYKKK